MTYPSTTYNTFRLLNLNGYAESLNGYIDDFRYYDGILSQSQITQLYNYRLTIDGSSLYNGLLRYYTFDTNTVSGTTLYNLYNGSSGYSDATINSTGAISNLDYVFGTSSFYCNGTSTYLFNNIINNISWDAQFTVSVWFKFPNFPTGQFNTEGYIYCICSIVNPTNSNTPLIDIDIEGDKYLWFKNDTVIKNLDTNAWHHAVWVQNSAISGSYYVNGNFIKNASSTNCVTSVSNYELLIGRYRNSSTTTRNKYYMNGNIDNFRFYNRALTDQEIAYLYNNRL